MKYSAVLLAALASPISAAVVTEVVHVTQYVYQQVDVYADENGNPVSTNVQYVSTSVSGDAAPVAAQTQTLVTDQATTASPTTTATPTTEAAPTSTAAPVEATTSAETTTAAAVSTPESTPETTTTAADNNYLYTKETSQEPATTSSTPEPTPETTAAPTTAAPTTAAATTTEAETTSSSAAPVETSSSSGSSDTYSGEATYYDPGLGACGETNSASDFIAALNVAQMGAQSNGNAVCGKKAQINYNGKSVIVTITDKCPGCSYGDLDLSPAAFQQLADESVGRIKMTWSFL